MAQTLWSCERDFPMVGYDYLQTLQSSSRCNLYQL
ncbi:hypothetical protein BCO37747_07302 [Burkholderia contaminans]|jgi:hypothetical protein|nr:hypothetical protein SK875_C00966 [Burkholderia contaminans]VWB06634.1 hypothetical protein BCO23253_00121 [Burkholderia contaminans]VWD60862.1 hypothetical protein BCO37747_07302 [Burkholderia contaminans]